MVKSEVTFDEALCKGCGLCIYFCPRGCIEMSKDKWGAQGNLLPLFIDAEKCNTCTICARMCPDLAIAVYVSIEEEPLAVT
jgi:2-oxoglutarate ferredoxin oxidoreductase subunit delta